MVTLKAPAGNGNMPSTSTNSQTVSASEVFRAEPLSKRTAGHADLEAEQQCQTQFVLLLLISGG